ncbi:putative MFS phosphate transporter [Talaromyces proteolyticus]|uniref:MFS phosphate transporter n=1 Tax=Talaromyces proteolyticus TaxID=1131652 RepID=A0AAD4KIS0_9EURO|nr:putative MFS phosphate transporter [Talaromyces proteolyticus]KAH8691293.1 putative MFS phosphate transporter [Talaromyces proteolyticus]
MATLGPNLPHGPDMAGTHPEYVDMNPNEKGAFDKLLRPDDSYTEEGVYWADLPILRRLRFITKVDNQEAARELRNLGRMIVEDPLSPVSFYFKNMVLPGAGLLLEGYVLFSIGNVTPLLQQAFPSCWKTYETCNETWINAINYLEISGIIVGQILVGYLGDWIGRRWGLIQDAAIMFVGLLMLTAAWGVTQNGWIICYAWSLFFYSIGVGGEYPMTATSGMENAVGSGRVSTREDRLHRGRKVTSAFLMQGWGQFLNQSLLILLLLIFHHGSGSPPYSQVAAQWTYRVSFAIPAVGTLWLTYYRAYHMKSASKQLQAIKKKASVTGYDVESLRLTFKHFGFRLLATTFGWFANDVFFYGNKLFQSQFIAVILPNEKSVMPNWLYSLLNIGVSLCGYYLASFLIDHKLYGRKWMQQVGFLMCFIFFIIPGFHYKYYTKPENIHAFQAMYFLSSFFNQFGPNCVTFIVAAECYPAPIRATAHGLSAAAGKLGALVGVLLGAYITVQQRFYVVPWFGLAGMITTALWLPDTTGLDLKEQERRWFYIRQGRAHEYHGVAVHPQHLSLWERFRGVGKYYDPELDYKQKLEDYRAEWEAGVARKISNEEGEVDVDTDETLFEGHVHQYFERTSPMFRGAEKSVQKFSALPPAAASVESDETEAANGNEK